MTMRWRCLAWMLAAWCGACGDGSGPDTGDDPCQGAGAFETLAGAPFIAGTVVTPTVRFAEPSGKPLSGCVVRFRVARGGGSVGPSELTTGADGRASVTWHLGVAAVPQRLQMAVGPAPEPDMVWGATFGAVADLEPAVLPAAATTAIPFAAVDAYLTKQGIDGSTEDLAFDPLLDRVVLGVPGHLLAVSPTGDISTLPLTGDALQVPLGLAYDADGILWVADSKGKALRRVDRTGHVTTLLTTDGTQPLLAPNDVAVHSNGTLYLTDVCLGEVIAVSAKSGQVLDVLPFDRATQGGPNGVTVSPDGQTLWLTTENTALFCPGGGNAPLEAPVAGLYRVPLTSTGFGERQTVHAALGLFGDGLGFDGEGNLYAIFDTQKDFALEESTVWVLTPGVDDTPRKLLAAKDRVFANLAFGRGAFGTTTLYLALLAVPVFTDPSMRGVERFVVGIAGPGAP